MNQFMAPVFPASPLGAGGTVSTAFNLAKRHFGLWFLLALAALGSAQVVFGSAVGLVVGLVLVVDANMSIHLNDNGIASAVLFGLPIGLGELVSLPLLFRFYGAFYAAMNALLQGRRPTVSSAIRESKGFLQRSLGLLLILGVLVVIASLAVVLGVLWLSFNSVAILLESDATVLGMAWAVRLGFFGLLVVGLYLYTKLYYLLPVLVVERSGSVASLARAWRLAKGEFWRTLGHIVLVGVIVMVPVIIILIVFSPIFLYTVLTLGTWGSLEAAGLSSQDFSDRLFGVLLLAFVSVIIVVPNLLLMAFVTLFSNVYRGVMYVDRVRRERGEVLPPVYPVGGYPPPAYPPPAYPAPPGSSSPQGYSSAEVAANVPPANPARQPSFEAPPEEPPGRPDFYRPSE